MALILIADDTPEIVTMLHDMLAMRGHQVAVANDGVEMIEKAKTLRPQLIVADIMMPGAYGSAAYRSLQDDPYAKNIPVVFLTALSPEQAKGVVPDSPRVRILHKPLDMTALFQALTELLSPA
ncbi:MAG: response regulator [Elusimicrobiota bacterium]